MGPRAAIAAHTATAASGAEAIRIRGTMQRARASCASKAAALIRKGRVAGDTTATGAPRNVGLPRRHAANAAPASNANRSEHTSSTTSGRARRYLAGRRGGKDARLAGLAQLRARADGGQEKSVAEHAGHVIVDVPNCARLPLGVFERKPRQCHAAAVGEEESGPRNQQAPLPRRDLIVVAANE